MLFQLKKRKHEAISRSQEMEQTTDEERRHKGASPLPAPTASNRKREGRTPAGRHTSATHRGGGGGPLVADHFPCVCVCDFS